MGAIQSPIIKSKKIYSFQIAASLFIYQHFENKEKERTHQPSLKVDTEMLPKKIPKSKSALVKKNKQKQLSLLKLTLKEMLQSWHSKNLVEDTSR